MTMTQHNHINHLITDNMDVWTSAIKRKSSSGRGSSKKIELYGIKKLRELILELAVRGKLVPQDPNDEPASALLERIAAEKAELVKQGKIKKPKKLPEITEDEKPFELPKEWEWVKLGDLSSDIHYGYTASAMPNSEGIRLLRITDIQDDKVNWSTVPACEVTPEKAKGYLLENNDILLARTGGTIGKSYLVENIDVKAVFASYLIRVRKIESMYASFIKVYLGSQLYWTQLYANSAGTGQPNVNATALKSLLFPVPPIEEQHCIVAKVDELMVLCDQLEAQTESSLDAHQTLVTALLDTLVNSQNPEELTENWMRISGHFDTLFTTEQSIDQLKQTILQLAVMGKLVEQNPNDEPASVLLERIAAEKDDLIKQGKIKKQKPLPPITEEEKPFELPEGWEWCRFGVLFKSFSNGLYKPAKFYTDAGVISLRMYNIQNGCIDFNAAKRVEVESKELEQFILEAGDLLINRVNSKELVGKTGIIPKMEEPLVYESMNMRAKPFTNYLSSEYLNLFMMTRMAQNSISLFAKEAIGQASINQGQVSLIKTPLPPFEEQHRIVAKVDELMAICDQLKTRLSEVQTTQLNLADALVEQAL
ncbi:restriction modification system subunit S [Marinomonas sp. BSi20414]|nr:restriction modification system subunit S [Marinomonas sp. BSi20414]